MNKAIHKKLLAKWLTHFSLKNKATFMDSGSKIC